jgi:hypothetical protein
MTDKKCSYMKLATENYEAVINSKINYCIYCYGTTMCLKDSTISSNNIYWISDKNGHTAACKECSVDAVIPGNYFINKTEDEICKDLSNWYNEGFNSL